MDLTATTPVVAALHEADSWIEVALHLQASNRSCQRSLGYSMPAPNAFARSLTPGGPACNSHAVAARFWLPRNCEVANRMFLRVVGLASGGRSGGSSDPPKIRALTLNGRTEDHPCCYR